MANSLNALHREGLPVQTHSILRTMIAIFFLSFEPPLSTPAHAMGSNPVTDPDLPEFHEVVKDAIYRGGQPTDAGIVRLAGLKIKTVLNLRDEDPMRAHYERRLVESLNIKMIETPISSIFGPSDETMTSAQAVLNDPSNYPIYIHCLHGQDRTGLAIGLYRVFTQKMLPREAYSEMVALGFRPYLIGLRYYFEEKTGYHPPEDLDTILPTPISIF